MFPSLPNIAEISWVHPPSGRRLLGYRGATATAHQPERYQGKSPPHEMWTPIISTYVIYIYIRRISLYLYLGLYLQIYLYVYIYNVCICTIYNININIYNTYVYRYICAGKSPSLRCRWRRPHLEPLSFWIWFSDLGLDTLEPEISMFNGYIIYTIYIIYIYMIIYKAKII